MATTTDPALQGQIIYSVYVRNHTTEGTFAAVEPDLGRIRKLGCDIVWLMPIHPIGRVARKGTLGSPYANSDYRAINPEYGTMDDFKSLVNAIHAQGMRVMIDVVYNHTSPDSVLFEQHPEFFYRRKDGTPGNRVGEWSDIIDLDYSVPGLWDYQIETLRRWAKIVDGFRCDVAPFVPIEFWKRARAAVKEVNPSFTWLAETVHRSFGEAVRREGTYCATDNEAFEAFDIEYSYDVEEAFERYLRGEIPLSCYLDLLDFQESVYPRNYNKLRFLENHDLPRIASQLTEHLDLKNLTSLLYLLKGTTLIYAGQELCATHKPSLFDKDPIAWDDFGSTRDLTPLMQTMARIKHEVLGTDDFIRYAADDANDIAVIDRLGTGGRSVGVFSLKSHTAPVKLDLPDGSYLNLIDDSSVQVTEGRLLCTGQPVVLHVDTGVEAMV